MIHTTQGIKLSDKEYHELHYVVLADDRFLAHGLSQPVIEKLKNMLQEADIDIKEVDIDMLELLEIVTKDDLVEEKA